MKKIFFLIAIFVSQISFSQDIHNEQACIEHYMLSHWDDLSKEPFQIIQSKDLFRNNYTSSFTILGSDKPNSVFYCLKTPLSDNSFMIFEKTEPNNDYSSIKALWFVKNKDSNLFQNEPSLFIHSNQLNDFSIFEFTIDYPL